MSAIATPAGTAISKYDGSGNVATKAPTLRVKPRVNPWAVEDPVEDRRCPPRLLADEGDHTMLDRVDARPGRCGLKQLVKVLRSRGDVGGVARAHAGGPVEGRLRDPGQIRPRVSAAIVHLERPANRERHAGRQA